MKDGDFSLNAEFDEIRNMPNESVISEEQAVDNFLDRFFAILEAHGIKTDNWDGDDPVEQIVANGILSEINASTARLREQVETLTQERDALSVEYHSRAIWIKQMNDILGYNNDDGFHCEPDPHTIARSLHNERDALKLHLESEQNANRANVKVIAELRHELAKSERAHEQLVNYLTAKLGTKGEHGVFETVDNVVARLAKLEAENQQRKQDCIAAVQSVLEARDLLSPGTNLSLKEAIAAWRKAASPVTDNPKEDAFYEK